MTRTIIAGTANFIGPSCLLLMSLALCVATSCTVTLAQGSAPAASKKAIDAPESAVRKSANEFSEAFKKQDDKAIAKLWTPNAVYEDVTGTEHRGRDAIQQVYRAFFEANPGGELVIDIESIRQVTPNVVVEHGQTAIVPPPAGAPAKSEYTAVHVKQNDGKWLLDSVRDSLVDVPTTYGELQHLELLTGDYSADHNGAEIDLSSTWNPNKSYLERRFVVDRGGKKSTSTEIIGWDPVTKQVTSWTFSGDGARNVGTWTPLEDGWVVRNRGITTGGVPTSSVDYWAPLFDGALGWRSTQRTANGQPVRSPGEVVLKQESAAQSK